MYRVVLIDDERIIVEGLRKVVKWADYGCQVVSTANDAASGADAIRARMGLPCWRACAASSPTCRSP